MPSNGRSDAAQRSVRRRVLEAAYLVFSRQGIAPSTLSEVAAEAGLDQESILSCFADKDDLVLALLEEQVLHRLMSAADRFIEAGNQEQGLADVGALLVEAMHVDAPAHRMLAEYHALTFHDPERRSALAARRREAHDAVARALTRLQELTGLSLALPPQQTAVVLLAVSNGLGIEAGINPEAVTAELFAPLLDLLVADR